MRPFINKPPAILILSALLSTAGLFCLRAGPECHAEESLLAVNKSWEGDFDGMEERRRIRVLMPYSKTHYFLDGAAQRGMAYEGVNSFEKWLNEKRGKDRRKIHVVILPTARERLFSDLVKGRGDIAAGNLTITPERLKVVDFSMPYMKNVREIVVAGSDAPPLETLDDLAGLEVFVRPSSSYYDSLILLNEKLKADGKEPVSLVKVEDFLEDEDLMEMADVGLISFLVVDEHKVNLWVSIFKNITAYRELAVRTGGEIGWAFRKNSPKLKKTVNQFLGGYKQGSLLFNIITRRYLKKNRWVRNATATEEMKRFDLAAGYLKKYAGRYRFDWLMMAALAYQESRIDQSLRSPAGAIGAMQVLPATAMDPNVDIAHIEKLENNIHAGVKYLRFLKNQYFEGLPMDDTNKTLFALASYNAGPGRIGEFRREAKKSGLDPNVWFLNVEIIASKRNGRETVQFVSNIYKYYTAYRIFFDRKPLKEAAKKKLSQSGQAPPRIGPTD